MFTCLDCDSNFDIEEDCQTDDIVVCPECDLKMIVLSTYPPMVDYAE